MWKLECNTRTLLITALAIAMNTVLYLAVRPLAVPLWLDTVGTAYAALALGPLGGVIPAIVNGFFLAAFFFDWDSTAYVAVSIFISLAVGWTSKSGRLRDIFSCCGLVTLVFLISAAMCVFLSFRLATDGNQGDYWGSLLYRITKPDFGVYGAAIIAIVLTKLPDTVVGALLTTAFWLLTPRSLRRPSLPQKRPRPPHGANPRAPEIESLPPPWLGDSRHPSLKIPKE